MNKVTDVFKIRLRELRGNKNQTDVAKEIGISRSALSYYESGERTPDINVLYSIAKYYNVTADYLLGLSDIPKPDIEDASIEAKTGLNKKAITQLKAIKSASVPEANPQFHLFHYLCIQTINLIVGEYPEILDILVSFLFYHFTHFTSFHNDEIDLFPIEDLELIDVRLNLTFSDDYDFYSNAILLTLNRELQKLKDSYFSKINAIIQNPEEIDSIEIINKLKLLFSKDFNEHA